MNNTRQSLFPGTVLKIGDTSVTIRPLSISQIATISTKTKAFLSALKEKGVTFENYSSGSNLIEVVVTLLKDFPDILAEASNIELEDLQSLPIEIIVEIVEAVIDINLKSKDTLEKNFKSLTEKFTGLTDSIQE